MNRKCVLPLLATVILYPLTQSGTIDNLGIGVRIFNIDQIKCNIYMLPGVNNYEW